MSCFGTRNVMLLACSGGSNVGQIANDAARALDSLGQGRMYCAIGVGSNIPGFADAAREAELRVAIDGCEKHCVRKALEALSIPVDAHLVVTRLGIDKAHRFDHTQEEVALAGDAVMKAVAA